MEKTVRVRDAGPRDADVICRYKAESVGLNFPGSEFDGHLFRRVLLANMRTAPDTVKVVEVAGEVAGYVWFKVVQSAVGRFGRIEHIFIDGRYRKNGLGKRLMAAAEESLRKKGVDRIKLTVTLKNKAALSLYRDLGYAVKRHVMEKDL